MMPAATQQIERGWGMGSALGHVAKNAVRTCRRSFPKIPQGIQPLGDNTASPSTSTALTKHHHQRFSS